MSDKKEAKGSTRDGFGHGLVEAAEKNTEVVGLCADLTESTKMHWFAEQFPQRYVQVGVAEQNLAGVAAGFAMTGKKAFCASYAAFHPGNSWGVIRTSICYNNLPVVIVGGHSGLGTGPDGATHQALEDVAIMQVLPNMTVVVPCDEEEARKATLALAELKTPAYLRTSKHTVSAITTRDTPFQIGKAVELKKGSEVTLIACGDVVEQALIAAEELSQQDISVGVLNMHTIKPLDVSAVLKAATESKVLITIENHQVFGGLGTVVSEVLAQYSPNPGLRFRVMAVQDTFAESGSGEELFEKFGLSAKHIVRMVEGCLK